MLSMFTLNLGNLYTYDSPQLFADSLMSYFNITTVEIGYLYTIYSAPNFVAAPLGGLMLSYIGLAWGSLILNVTIFISTVMCFLSISTQNYWLMLAGRGVFGLGAESIIVA